MPSKPLVFTGLLLLCSTFLACSPSSSKKDQTNPPASPLPVKPGSEPTPNPSPVPTPTPAPGGDMVPPEQMIGDWQSIFSDANYFGNVTYSVKADGRVLMSLMLNRKGQRTIMAERHEFKGSFNKVNRQIKLEHIQGSCTPKNSTVTIFSSPYNTDQDILFLGEGFGSSYLRLSKVRGGLSQDVHSLQTLRGRNVEAGCFVEGRLNQFVPQSRG